MINPAQYDTTTNCCLCAPYHLVCLQTFSNTHRWAHRLCCVIFDTFLVKSDKQKTRLACAFKKIISSGILREWTLCAIVYFVLLLCKCISEIIRNLLDVQKRIDLICENHYAFSSFTSFPKSITADNFIAPKTCCAHISLAFYMNKWTLIVYTPTFIYQNFLL